MVVNLLMKKKLLRIILSTKMQFIALALIVMMGSGIYIGLNSFVANFNASQEKYFNDIGTPDYVYIVSNAPENIINDIEKIRGVKKVSGRLQEDIKISISDGRFLTLRLTSYRVPFRKNVSGIFMLNGTLFKSHSDKDIYPVILDKDFYNKNLYKIGDIITAKVNDNRIKLRVVGSGTSPEFFVPQRDALNMFEDNGFGIGMMSQKDVQDVFGLPDQNNQILIKFSPGYDKKLVRKAIKKKLADVKIVDEYEINQKDLKNQAESLKAASRILPVIFFAIAIGFVFITIRQIIKAQRVHIGILKSIGYRNGQIIPIYTVYSIAGTMLGAAASILLGDILQKYITGTYLDVFNIQIKIKEIRWQAVAFGSMLSIVTGTLSGIISSRSIALIHPAEAMKLEPPKIGKHSFLENFSALWGLFPSSFRMAWRSIMRNKVRFSVSSLGVAASAMLLLCALLMTDSSNFILKQYFHRENTYDYLAQLNIRTDMSYVKEISRYKEIERAEPVLRTIVKVAPLSRLAAYDKEESETLCVLSPRSSMKSVYNGKLERIFVSERGIVISDRIAKKFGISVGDRIRIRITDANGDYRKAYVFVSAICSYSYGGSCSYMSYRQAKEILNTERIINGILIKAYKGRDVKLLQKLRDNQDISCVLDRVKQETFSEKSMNNMIILTIIVSIIAVILAFTIIYSTSILSFNDRKKEIVTLSVIGYGKGKILILLMYELILEIAGGCLIGLPMGKLFGEYYTRAISTDFMVYRNVIYRSTYFMVTASVFVISITSYFTAMVRLRKLDIIEELKNRE